MLVHPQFDPVAIHIPLGFTELAIRWYGLMYLVAFGLFVGLARLQLRRPHVAAQGWNARDIDDMLFWGLLGVILGGRLGYVLFYKPAYYFEHLAEIAQVWHGGMSFHGGFLGVLVAMAAFGASRGRPFFQLMDFVAPCVPAGLAAGRLGNFINGELWGRPTDVPWAMVFPQVDDLPRHPSQLYQFAGEGLALFVLMWLFSRRPRPTGMVSAAFLVGYGVFRFLAEFGREPDNFLGLLTFGLSMGQLLSLPMIVAGVLLGWAASRRVLPRALAG
ncbi:prolipoprotein diacylglyceryl transferase [Derxia gummosa]|uniref:Phosphatidylglycerol--prolipoprotein diacylglyceryl transferase n=1 Tax=Derxia gummosa DSM 723 TaxID=1121388 RepID=A0A8B6X1F6_9BURK|nr:prolipoprotein diacylglyceryl transferase [Derxia gummosa]